MFRSTLLGSILAVCMAPLSVGINALVNTQPQASIQPENTHLADSLSLLSNTLVSFEQRQAGSEAALTEQLQSLASAVSQTQTASQSQIDLLSKSLEEVKQVAAQDEVDFKQLLSNFATNLEKKIDAKLVAAQVEKESPPVPESKGVGTLDVNAIPSESNEEVASIQTMSDAARRIIALEKEVAALKARSVASTVVSPPQVAVRYEPYPSVTYSVASGGSTGSFSGGSTGTASYSSQPVYSYPAYQTVSQPTYYASPQSAAPRRSTSFSRTVQSRNGTCRIVNGQRVCN